MIVQPAFGESGLQWALEANEKAYTNYADAIARFYRDFEEGCYTPLAQVLNPEKGGVLYFPYSMVRLMFYRRNYRICLIKHHTLISGPHVARLQLQSTSEHRIHWLASCQIIGNFYSEALMDEKIIEAIQEKQFYVSPKSATDKLLL